MVSTSRLRHQISSDDEDENLIISYTSDAQTRSPTNEVFLKNEYGKEKTDQEIDDAAVTNLKKHQTLSGRPVKWPQQPAFVVLAVGFTKHINQKNISCSRMFILF